jgi:glycosyltransferase involved in cell wall biosynthesis
VTRYLEALLPRLVAAHPDDRFRVLVPGAVDPAARRSVFGAPNLGLRETRVSNRLLYGAAALTGRPRLDRLLAGCDVVWAPAVAPLAVSAGVPLVMTVHDLSFEHRPADFSAYERAWHRVAHPRRLGARADRLIAVSQAVAGEVVSEWGLPAERVVVVRSGPGRTPPTAPAGGAPPAIPPGYVLAVGALEPRKRPDLLAEAHRRARAAGLGAGLVFVGDGPLREELAAGGAAVLGHVADEELERLYGGALAVACVSREEGFAFTPLEALTRGVPAIVSDLPVFAETLGEGALRVPPGDVGALAAALLRVEREPALRERLVESGRRAAAALSWDQAAARTREVLAAAAGAA